MNEGIDSVLTRDSVPRFSAVQIMVQAELFQWLSSSDNDLVSELITSLSPKAPQYTKGRDISAVLRRWLLLSPAMPDKLVTLSRSRIEWGQVYRSMPTFVAKPAILQNVVTCQAAVTFHTAWHC